MNIIEIKDQKIWDGAVLEQGGSFLQSWSWGEFQYQYGRPVHRLALPGAASLQLIEYPLPAGKIYFFSPSEPLFSSDKYFNLFFAKIKELASQRRAIFWRFEPRTNDFSHFKKVADVEPSQTLILSLNQVDLINAFKPKTRYNIHLAEKKGVQVRVSENMDDLDHFYALLKKTAGRQGIRLHPKDYYQLMLKQENTRLYLAEYQDQIIAANLMIAFGPTMTYLHGGSNHEHRQLMAPHLLQWAAIKDAQSAGLKYYDFYGIDETKWPGITRFKQGFACPLTPEHSDGRRGGQVKNYSGTFEIPLNQVWYQVYRGVKKLKG